MEFQPGNVIDSRFSVKGVCNDGGGMGVVLFVEDIQKQFTDQIVLKYCREENEDFNKRFKREIRLLSSFNGNSKVAQVLHSNLDHEPPYFVMKYYPDGDLGTLGDSIKGNFELQENIIDEMLSCVNELHSKNIMHRDIKPQNFLRDDENLIISDLGLGLDPDSDSRFTSSSKAWGTFGYHPPEYVRGGFKNADPTVDIFMIGKTIYALLINNDPTYIVEEEIPAPLRHVVTKCCDLNKEQRYQNIAELRQALSMAFDVLIGRGGPLGEVYQLWSVISERIEKEKFIPKEIIEFTEKLNLVEEHDQIKICLELKRQFFSVLIQDSVKSSLRGFLRIYTVMVESEQYGWSFAEEIAKCMERIFSANNVDAADRKRALELAIDAAYRMNRFAAMDTCIAMIKSVIDEEFGLEIASIIQSNPHGFIQSIEPSECGCQSIRNAIISINKDETDIAS